MVLTVWLASTEAPLRMLMNNLDPDVAENCMSWWSTVDQCAARNWECYDRYVVDALTVLEGGRNVAYSESGKTGRRIVLKRTTTRRRY